MLFKDIGYADENFSAKTGSILVENDVISWIGSGIPDGYAGEVYDGTNKMMLPGFYNIHCHVPMVLLRGYGEGLPLHQWLNEKIFPFEGKLDSDAVYWGSLLGIAEMIKSGAISFTDMYFYMESIARAVDECGVKANLCNGTMSFTEGERYIDTRSGKETKSLAAIARSCKHGRIRCDAAVHAEYTSYPSIVRETVEFAKENNLRMQVHVSETEFEHSGCKTRRGGLTPAAYLLEHGVFDVPTTAAHCVLVEDSDIEIFLEKGVTIAHCPSSNLKLGSGIARIWDMHKKGVNIGIGTDGASSNNNLNMLEEATLASLLQKGAGRDPLCMDTSTTLRMASLNGARSQGRGDCGLIKVGSKADLVVLDMDKPHLQPVFDVLANVLYSAQASDICMTMADGKILYKDGELLTIDIEKVLAEAKASQQKVLSHL